MFFYTPFGSRLGLDLVPAEGDAVLSVLVSVTGNLNVPELPDVTSGPVIFRFDATQLGAGSGGGTEGTWSPSPSFTA